MVMKAADVSVADGNRLVIKNISDPQRVHYAPENRYFSTENANLCSGTGVSCGSILGLVFLMCIRTVSTDGAYNTKNGFMQGFVSYVLYLRND